MAHLTFRKVGKSIMACFPQAALDFLNVKPGDTVEYVMEGDQLVVFPNRTKKFTSRRYSLDQLIEEQKQIQEELNNDWSNESSCGEELL